MVEKFKQLLGIMIGAKGPVTLFAIVKMDDLTDKWTVMLCAPWADEAHSQEAFGYLYDLIQKHFTDEEKNSIARIGVFNKKEHLIELMLRYKKDAVIENEKINGNRVHQAYIIESDSAV
jgi:hypothetical protein